jgi:hypothetical protein
LLQLAAIQAFAQTSATQVAPTGTGDVLTYQYFNAEKKAFGRSPTPVWEAPKWSPYGRKLTIEGDGTRKYSLMSGKPGAVFTQSFTRIENMGKSTDASEQFPLLQPGQKPTVGQKWEFARGGIDGCGAWGVKYTSVIKNGPDVKMVIKAVDTTVKTLLIEHRGTSTHQGAGCDPSTHERNVLYSPDLHEIVADQLLIFVRGDVEEGYKWSLLSVK